MIVSLVLQGTIKSRLIRERVKTELLQVYSMRLLFCLLVSLLGLVACSEQDQAVRLQGMQGTASWHVTISDPPAKVNVEEIRAGIEEAFSASSDLIATWREDSELSRFNRYQNTDWFPVSPKLVELVGLALELSEQSNGTYDITVGPLLQLWGFGAGDVGKDKIPSQADIEATLANIGYQKLQVRNDPPAIRKVSLGIQLELASLADGFAADQAGLYLESLGIKHYMVEIAGEIRSRGLSSRGDAWRIAIEKPEDGERSVQLGVQLHDAGLATSGDYRNYFVKGGKRYSHTLDPATGYPIEHSLTSVSVLAEQATLADAYATLLLAIGEQKAIDFANNKDIAAYFIWRTDEGFATYMTEAFKQRIQ